MKVASLFDSLNIWWWVEKVQANVSLWLTDLWYEFHHLILNDKQPRNNYAWSLHLLWEEFILWFWITKIYLLIRLAWKIKEYCNKHDIDVIIGQWDFFFMVTWLSRLFWNKSKLIAVVHTSIWVWHSFVVFVMRLFLQLHHHIVMTSQVEMDTFLSKYSFSRKKVSLIYNAIDIPKVLQQGGEDVDPAFQFLFTAGKTTLVNLARLNYQKNQSLLIRAFSELDNEDLQLILIWEGNERQNLESLIQELNLTEKVFLLWNQKNPHAFVAKSDYWVLSSRFEWFPVVFSEWWLFGKPMIAVDCPTWPREFLDPEGKLWPIDWFALADNGILVQFDEQNPEYLKKGLEFILNHDISVQQQSVQEYCQKFDNTTNAKKRDSILKFLV